MLYVFRNTPSPCIWPDLPENQHCPSQKVPTQVNNVACKLFGIWMTWKYPTRIHLDLFWSDLADVRRKDTYAILLCMQTVFYSIRSNHLVKLLVFTKCSWIFCLFSCLFTYGKKYHFLQILVRHVIRPCNDLWTSNKVHMELNIFAFSMFIKGRNTTNINIYIKTWILNNKTSCV
jgi:hypothetical protein